MIIYVNYSGIYKYYSICYSGIYRSISGASSDCSRSVKNHMIEANIFHIIPLIDLQSFDGLHTSEKPKMGGFLGIQKWSPKHPCGLRNS